MIEEIAVPASAEYTVEQIKEIKIKTLSTYIHYTCYLGPDQARSLAEKWVRGHEETFNEIK